MPKVKCIYCQEEFDRDKVKCQKVGRRYAHLTCHEPRIDVTGLSFNALIQYCGQLLSDSANFRKITSQVKDYCVRGMSYNDIYLTLKYWYEIKKESTAKAMGGIGIVAYVAKEAKDYWKSVEPKRIPKIEEEEVVITYKKRKKLLVTDDWEG